MGPSRPQPIDRTRTMSESPPLIDPGTRKQRLRQARDSAAVTLARLQTQHPTAHCELDHSSPFELLVAVVLSAQTTDVAVNKATPRLFARYPDAPAMAKATPQEIEPFVASLGFFRAKSKAIVGLARSLVTLHRGNVPRSLDALIQLPGVGRKTANVVLGVAFGCPAGIVVDTHVSRVSQRLGWTRQTDPTRIESDISQLFSADLWDRASHTIVIHGRRCCEARNPRCSECSVNDLCPSAFDAVRIGRKRPTLRTK